MGLGKKLKAVLRQERITNKEMAKIVGVTSGSLDSYLREKTKMPASVLIKACSYEGIDKYVFWLMTGETNTKIGQCCPSVYILKKYNVTD